MAINPFGDSSVNELKEVTMTKTVKVKDRETLEAWLNEKLEVATGHCAAGTCAIDLIIEAGFTLTPPKIKTTRGGGGGGSAG